MREKFAIGRVTFGRMEDGHLVRARLSGDRRIQLLDQVRQGFLLPDGLVLARTMKGSEQLVRITRREVDWFTWTPKMVSFPESGNQIARRA